MSVESTRAGDGSSRRGGGDGPRANAKARPRAEGSGGGPLIVIGALKLVGAVLLAMAGFGVLRLIHRDLSEDFVQFVKHFHLDPDGRLVKFAGEKIAGLTPGRIHALSLVAFFYALLEGAEGIGLVLRKRWAEYLTVVATASLLPLELYEIYEKVNAVRVLVLAVNLAILIYLIVHLRRHPKDAASSYRGRVEAREKAARRREERRRKKARR